MNKRRLKKLYEVIRAINSRDFDISQWGHPVSPRRKAGCGTVGCTLGHYILSKKEPSRIKKFASAFGFEAIKYRRGWSLMLDLDSGIGSSPIDLACHHFDISCLAAVDIFLPHHCSPALNKKRAVLKRIKDLMESAE